MPNVTHINPIAAGKEAAEAPANTIVLMDQFHRRFDLQTALGVVGDLEHKVFDNARAGPLVHSFANTHGLCYMDLIRMCDLVNANFKTGDKAKTHQIPQSVIAGVGQDVTCKRGEYLERWVCTSMFAGNRPKEWSDKDATLFYCDTPMPIQREMFERAKRHVAGHKLGPRPYAFVKS
jgi:hypothetical protein